MAYPMWHDPNPQGGQGLNENMTAGEPTYGGLGPHGAMASVGGYSPAQLAIMGVSFLTPPALAAYKWWNRGSEPDQPYQPPPAEPEYDWKNDPEGLFQLNPFIPDKYKGQQ